MQPRVCTSVSAYIFFNGKDSGTSTSQTLVLFLNGHIKNLGVRFMEETTTVPVEEAGANALPVEQTAPTAENTENHAQDQEAGATALPANDEKLVKFAESHGITLDSESAIKAAKIAMDNQSAYQQAQSKTAQLEKSLQTQPTDNVEADRVQRMEREFGLMKFKSENPDWKEHEPAMVEKLSETVQTPYGVFPRSELVNAGFLSLNDVYVMAKGASAQPQESVKDVLQSIANKQRAGGVSANAVNSAPSASDPVLEAIKRSRGEN